MNDNSYKNILGNFNVCILGAYYPQKSYNKLIKLRDYLIDNDFTNAKLVEDNPHPPSITNFVSSHSEQNILHSQYTMKNSNALVFVFSNSDKSQGHYMELQYFQDELYSIFKEKTIFLIEKGALDKLSSLIRGFMNGTPRTFEFNKIEEICKYTRTQLISMLIKP